MSVKLALFDCDGTLVNGQAGVVGAMDAAFAACGLPLPDRHQVRRLVGLSLPQAIALLLPGTEEDLRREVDACYREAFRSARKNGALVEPLYEGMREALLALRDAGWTLGVATGKARRGLDHCLATHELSGLFATLQTADGHPSKPHPSMIEAALAETLALAQDTVMIGDTQYDIEMAVNAGVRAIGVDWGYHTPDELRAAGAEAVATAPLHLVELLR
ncbi:MAG: HAD-IA family hydrolase [Novosphingobium sp.]|uniref:HAD-IA family hydrolase n=1 Tax=Novosphingobium sp. TaxID=1874826 RepID=UPI001D7F7A7A|nr:HAD-IA family hydrolase [Novosphingobium sp.]MCB2057670.1 HAD-IA family hydrolase [Novosphingobium sp.]MCP5387677.1 HAD-IA family hydrolase [Novosphingobium sp.]